MKKYIAIGSALTVALGLSACTPSSEAEGDAAPEATEAAVDEPAMEAATEDGTMAADTGTDETAAEATETTGPDHDGNPVDQ